MIDPDHLEALLRCWPVARLATADASGRPHIVPIVFCAEAARIYSPIDGKPKSSARLKRLENIRNNPQASLLLDRYDDDWQRLWWIRLDGHAEVYRPDATHAATLGATLRAKYHQYEDTRVFDTEPLLIRFNPQKVNGWAPQGIASAVLDEVGGQVDI